MKQCAYTNLVEHECEFAATHRVWADVSQEWVPACPVAARLFERRTIVQVHDPNQPSLFPPDQPGPLRGIWKEEP